MTAQLYTIYDSSDFDQICFDKPFKIASISSYGNLVFIGSVDGRIFQLVFEEIEEQRTCYTFSVIISRQISDHPVREICASQYSESVASLSDTHLQFWDAEKLEFSNLLPTLDNVSTFSLRDKVSTTERTTILAVANLSHTIQVYRCTGRRTDLLHTVNIPANAIALLCLETYAVLATTDGYFCINLNTCKCIEIFDRNASCDAPMVVSVSETEFLLSGPGALGVFVNSSGQSERPPLKLSSNLSGLFCRNRLVFAVDDEFVSVHCVNQQKQLQTLCSKGTGLACISLDRNLIILACPSSDRLCLRVLRPETWDLVANRLILAGCLSDAIEIIDLEYTKLVKICTDRPATSSGVKNMFYTRSKRVYTLMGFYYFEVGQLDNCREFFEKSSLDIRELLYRFVDLLPRGYAFTPDPKLNVMATSKVNPEWTTATTTNDDKPPCTIFDLTDSTTVSVPLFRLFLLDFLVANRHGRIFSNCTQFVETALVKVCVQLRDHCQSPGNGAYDSWDQLVNSLSDVDVDDLLAFLDENDAPHVKALLCRWNGDVDGALAIWKSLQFSNRHELASPPIITDHLLQEDGAGKTLAFEEAADVTFPGSGYYTDALYTALVRPFAFRGHTTMIAHNHHTDPPAPSVNTAMGHTPSTAGSVLYADLVSRHLDHLLERAADDGADAAGTCCLLRRLARITTWAGTTTSPSSASNFVFSTPAVIKRLLPGHPVLAEEYLWVRVFQAHDRDPSHHILLAEVQLDLLLRYLEENKPDCLREQRSRFRLTLTELEDCRSEALLDKIKTSSYFNHLTEEYVTLLGKLSKYDEALEFLLGERQNLEAALRFCAWCTNLQERRRLSDQSVMWLKDDERSIRDPQNPRSSSQEPNAYTVLFRLVLTSNDPDRAKQASQLMEAELPCLDFAMVCKLLPDDWALTGDLASFLYRAVGSSLDGATTSDLQVGLTGRLSAVSRIAANTTALSRQQGLEISEESMCCRCRKSLVAFGLDRPFAWLLHTTDKATAVGGGRSARATAVPDVVHLHCLPPNSNL